jgi:hypothetical protein
MPSKAAPTGQCSICGAFGKLSLEHVPPKEAFNKSRVVEYSFEDAVRRRKPRGAITQGGVKNYTLCRKCNNDTGRWYGGEYVTWAKTCMSFLAKRAPAPAPPDEARLTLHGVYPLRFLKQVIVCFFSVTPNLAQLYPGLSNYVLDPRETRLPSDCRFYLNFYHGPKPYLRYWPLAAKITVTGDLRVVSSRIFSEIGYPPFALIMAEGPGFTQAGEITSFSKHGYNEQVADLSLILQVVKGTEPYPGSFR